MNNQARLAIISSKLQSLNQTSYTSPRGIDPLESRLTVLEHKITEWHDSEVRSITSLKAQLSRARSEVERESERREEHFMSKARDLENTHEHLQELLSKELNNRAESDNRILKFLNDKVTVLRQEIAHEAGQRAKQFDELNSEILKEMPILESKVRSRMQDLGDLEQEIQVQALKQIEKIDTEVQSSKNSREKDEEDIFALARDIVGKLSSELEQETRERENTEENILSLLEETCAKLDSLSNFYK